MKHLNHYLKLLLLTIIFNSFNIGQMDAQVGINTNGASPNASAMLDISSTDKGILIPRMTTAERELINSPATGLMVYDSDESTFWYYNGTAWTAIGSGAFTSENGLTAATNKDDDFLFGSDSLNIGTSNESKLFFDKSKSAFRAGYIGNENWDEANIGLYSFGIGTYTKASGEGAFAHGYFSEAAGIYSTAFGYQTNASGNYSTALGGSTTASGYYAQASGYATTANEYATIAFGSSSTASGQVASAFGNNTTASGWYSTSFGQSTEAYSFGEMALGTNNTTYTPNSITKYDSEDRLFVIGNGKDGNNRSDALVMYKNGNTTLNGALTINDAFTFPTTDGTVSQVLITDGNGAITWADNTDNDNQSLTLSTNTLSLEDGGTVDLSSYLDNTDHQTLSLSNTTLTIADGNSVDLSSIDTDTDDQTIDVLSLSGNTLQLSLTDDGEATKTLDLSAIDTDTDNQTIDELSLSGTSLQLSLTNDGEATKTLDLSAIDTDDQTLSFSNTTLTISEGNDVDLSNLKDNLGDHIATSNIQLTDNWLSNDGDNEGIQINNDGQVGIGTSADASAILDVTSSDKGLLLPRMTTEERDAIENPATGLIIYNLDDDCFNYYADTTWVKNCGRSLTADSAPTATSTAGSTASDTWNGIAIDSEDNIILTGHYSADLTIGDSTFVADGTTNALLIKMDKDQKILWSIQHSDINFKFEDVETDDSNQIFLLGKAPSGTTFEGVSFTEDAVFVVKYDANGNFIWLSHGTSSSSLDMEDMAIGSDGSIALAGYLGTTPLTWGTVTATSDIGDGLVLKLDSNGDAVWAKLTDSDTYAYYYGVEVAADGSIYTGGEMEGTTIVGTETFVIADGVDDGLLVKYNSDGSFAWATQLEGTDYTGVYGMMTDTDGNVYMTGAFCTALTLGGITLNTTGCSTFIVKLSADGTVLWADAQTSTNNAFGWRIVHSPSGNIIIAGGFRDDITFNGTTYSGVNSSEIYATAYASDGTPLWLQIGTGTSSESILDLDVNSEGYSYLAGFFRDDLQLGDQIFNSTGSNDLLLVEITADGSLETYQNTLDETQDLDRDSSNEIQDLSLDGTNLTISEGSTIDLSGINPDTDTDNQTIDVLSLSNNTLQISLEDDGQNTYELDLSAIDTDTDEQTIDELSISNNKISISLEGDGESPVTLDLSSIDTDNQTIDELSLTDNVLSISLEGDSEVARTIDLSDIDTDTNTQLTEAEVDDYVSNNGYLTSIDNTDSDPTNEIELPSGGSEGQTIVQDSNGDLIWSDNTVNQTVDEFTLTDDVLSISLASDEQEALTVDLSTLSKTLLEDADGDTKIQVEASDDEDYIRLKTVNVEALQVNSNQQVGIGKPATSRFNVAMGASGASTSSASNSGGSASDNPGTTWQSYTATTTGRLERVDIRFQNASGNRTVTIYQGEGTDGVLLGTATIDATTSGVATFSFELSDSEINQISGEMYTIGLDDQDGVRLSTSSNYSGGMWQNNAEWDMDFNVYTQDYLDGFQVSDHGVTINDYTFPTSDGTANQVLVTDGAGNLSWSDVTASLRTNSETTQRLIKENENLTVQLKLQKAKMEQLEILLQAIQTQVNHPTIQKVDIGKK